MSLQQGVAHHDPPHQDQQAAQIQARLIQVHRLPRQRVRCPHPTLSFTNRVTPRDEDTREDASFVVSKAETQRQKPNIA